MRPFHTSRLVSSSKVRMRVPFRSTRFSIGSRRYRSILKSLGSNQLNLGRMAAVTKKPLAVEVTPLFDGCEPHKRDTEARSRTTSYATPSTGCGGVSMRIGFWRLARRATLFTTGNRHGIYLLSRESQVPVRRLLVSISAGRGETNVRHKKPPQNVEKQPSCSVAATALLNV